MGNSEWIKTTWGEAVSLEYGKSLRGYNKESGGYRVFGSNGPIGWTHTPLTQGPGVILGRKGAYRGVQFCQDDFWVIDTAYFVKPKILLNIHWLYYAIRFHKLGEIDDGSPIPSTTRSAVYVRDLSIPPLPIQNRIAHVLGTLDDKIELNRKMNQTLEAMAQAIFKSWFVDFDPVHAKAEGRDTGLPPEIDALFPDSFVESELGLIPEGWEVKRTEEIIKRESVGKRYSKKTSLLFGKIPILDQSANGIIGFHNDDPGINTTSDSPIAIFTNHTCNMRLVNFPFSAIQNVIPFTGLNVSTTWAYYATYGRQKFIEYKGHWPDFIVHRVVVPSTSLTQEYAAFVQPLSERLWFNQNRATTLAALRDTLLPKLLSGEVSVEDVEMEDVEMEDVEMEDVG